MTGTLPLRCSLSPNPRRAGIRRLVQVIIAAVSYERLIECSFDKVRQAGRGMPAVMIRQLDALGKVMATP